MLSGAREAETNKQHKNKTQGRAVLRGLRTSVTLSEKLLVIQETVSMLQAPVRRNGLKCALERAELVTIRPSKEISPGSIVIGNQNILFKKKVFKHAHFASRQHVIKLKANKKLPVQLPVNFRLGCHAIAYMISLIGANIRSFIELLLSGSKLLSQ